jgi:hypothetical protein
MNAVNATAERQKISEIVTLPSYAKTSDLSTIDTKSALPTGTMNTPPATSGTGAATSSNTRPGSGTAADSTQSGNGAGSVAGENTGSSISRSDQIALGVGIGIGVPTVLMTALAWWYPRHRKAAAAGG